MTKVHRVRVKDRERGAEIGLVCRKGRIKVGGWQKRREEKMIISTRVRKGWEDSLKEVLGPEVLSMQRRVNVRDRVSWKALEGGAMRR